MIEGGQLSTVFNDQTQWFYRFQIISDIYTGVITSVAINKEGVNKNGKAL